ncbi:MAG: Lrp/AsnC family transcriptional regulator [Gracilibacteraceae bacterium]|jgi:DNA-binding Lrp family transcriptional regulator|nr:Lrp/AsnC family transcriptional regulator [Gracilibacteraceae bacterium]
MLSEDERRLLHVLADDCRQTPETLSVQTGLNTGDIASVLAQWEKDRIIVKYKPMINWEKLEENRVTAFIDVKVRTQRDQGYDRIAARFQKFPEIRSVYLMSGENDLCLVAEGANMYEVARFVSDKLSPLESVENISTRFVLRRYKEDGVELLGAEERLERLLISP